MRRLFESVVQRCIAEGLVSADGFAVDASLIAADANKQRSVPSREWKSEEIKETATRATQEYLATLDNAAFGAASPVTPKFISRSDPAAQWTGAHKGHAFFAYANNYLIDTDHGVIVDVEATRAIRQAEVGAARTMLERTETRFGIKPAFLAADSAYGSAESLAWLVKRKEIAPHIPVFDKSNRTDGTFSRADFVFDTERDRYTCPAGKELVQFRRTYAIPRSGVTAEGARLYRASKLDCDVCKLKAQCCPNALARKIPRDLDEDARDVARALAATPQYVEACRRRKKIEMLFAHLKRILRLTPLAPQGSERRKRRVPACGDRTKPETSRPPKTNQHPSGNAGRLNATLPTTGRKQKQKTSPTSGPGPQPKPRQTQQFFNGIRTCCR